MKSMEWIVSDLVKLEEIGTEENEEDNFFLSIIL